MTGNFFMIELSVLELNQIEVRAIVPIIQTESAKAAVSDREGVRRGAGAACSFPESRRRKTQRPHLPSGGCRLFVLYYFGILAAPDANADLMPAPTGGGRPTP
jgi:hypothetical protein